MCTVARVDSKDFNTSATQNLGILLEDATNAYIFWCGVDPATRASGLTHNSEIWVRPINKTTLALGTAFRIDANDVVGGEEPWDWDGVAVCRLDSGVMIAAYGTSYLGVGPSIHAKETSNPADYTSWGSRVGFVAGQFRCTGGLATDGTGVWLLSQDSSTADLYIHERTAANTWALATTALTGGKIFDSLGFSSSAPFFNVSTNVHLSCMRVMVKDGSNGCIVLPYAQTTTTQDAIAALCTQDGWLTSNAVVLVKNYAASADTISSGTAPKLIYDAPHGILYCMWIEHNAAANKFYPVLAKSEDFGLTWDVLGTPTPFKVFGWDNDWDGAFNIDSQGRLYVSGFDTSDGSNVKHRLFKGTYSLTDWAVTLCEHIESTSIGNVASGTQAECFINAAGDFVRVFDGVAGTDPAHNEVSYLIEEGVVTPEIPPPPLVEESPSGSDANNTYLRDQLSTKRGWSGHDFPVGCWAVWGEGDFTTQRRLPILLAGVSTLDPSVTDPTLLGAIYKLDDPEHFGREVWTRDSDGNIVPRYDPDRFQWWTKAFPLGPTFEQGVLRGIMLRYRRPNLPLTVETWVDGVIAQTDVLPPTGPDDGAKDVAAMSEVFLPLAPYDNVGSVAQLRIEDETLDDLVIEECLIMWIPKKVRG